MTEKPKTITLYNLPQFFNYRSIGSSSIKPGMLVQFRYNSPEGVHDVKPLIFVLEKKMDRVWGLNFHYQFGLMPMLLEVKNEQVQKYITESYEYKKYQKEIVKPKEEVITKPKEEEITQDGLPDAKEVNKEVEKKEEEVPIPDFDPTKVRYPNDLLEIFINDKIVVPKGLLRNYLYPRMTGLYKLTYKV